MAANGNSGGVYVACVPHSPLVHNEQERKHELPGFWDAYEARVAELDAFDPDLVINFGADHYSNIHLNLMPSFLIGFKAQAIDDRGGIPGKLDVPTDLAVDLANHLVESGLDMATSYDMTVDHGFSGVMHFFFHGKLDSRPSIPIYINCLAEPRPTFRRCRELGEAVGEWAAKTGKRVAFLGSGGLSHGTGSMFPQFHDAPSEDVRRFIVSGGSEDGITDEKWHADISEVCDKSSDLLRSGVRLPSVICEWDQMFLDTLAAGDLTVFDGWKDADVNRDGGGGAAEIRLWIAAVAAAQKAGSKPVTVDYYSHDTTFGVGSGIVHALAA